MASRPDSIVSGLLKPDDIDDDRPGTEHTFASETTAGWDTDLEIDGKSFVLTCHLDYQVIQITAKIFVEIMKIYID